MEGKLMRIRYYEETPGRCSDDDAYIIETKEPGGEWQERKDYHFHHSRADEMDSEKDYLFYGIIPDIWRWIDSGYTMVH